MTSEPVTYRPTAVDPRDLILVTGHSGAGKSHTAGELAKRLGLPVVSIDDHPDNRALFKNDPNNLHLVTGSQERLHFFKERQRIAREILSSLQSPSIVEGSQIAQLPSKELQQYPNRVLVKTPLAKLLEQRIARVKSKALAKGKPWDDEIEKKRFDAGREIYDGYRSTMNRASRVPGTVIMRNHKQTVDEIMNQLGIKQASQEIPSFFASVKHHLPNIRLFDSVAGALGGAGLAGLGTALTSGDTDSTKEKSKKHYLRNMLVGAAAGAVGGNIVGDRFRRYVVNNLPAAGYGNSDHGAALRPKSVKQVWDTLVMDRPSESVLNIGPMAGREGQFSLKPDAAAARYELFRRSMDLPIADPSNAFFREVGRQDWAPTETSGGVPGNFRTIELNPARFQADSLDKDSTASKFKSRIRSVYRNPDREGEYPAMGDYLSRHGYRRDSEGNLSIEDLWDFALTPDEETQLKKYAKEFVRQPSAMNQIQSEYKARTSNGWKSSWDPLWEGTDHIPTKLEHAREMLKRKLLNTLLLRDGGVLFKQKFDRRGELVNKTSASPLRGKVSELATRMKLFLDACFKS